MAAQLLLACIKCGSDDVVDDRDAKLRWFNGRGHTRKILRYLDKTCNRRYTKNILLCLGGGGGTQANITAAAKSIKTTVLLVGVRYYKMCLLVNGAAVNYSEKINLCSPIMSVSSGASVRCRDGS